MDVSHYQSPQDTVWEGRTDSDQPERFYQLIQLVDWRDLSSQSFPKQTIAFVGFACDEGVKRNNGRIGAKEGPDALRKALSNYPLHDKAAERVFIDLGNITAGEGTLEKSQSVLASLISDLIKKDIFPIVLGGGHETAWGHYQGFIPEIKNDNLAIVNFDAHFDMRTVLADGQGSSGTPFLQIAQDREKNQQPFYYYCIGIQKSANTKSLFQTAKKWDVHYISCEEVYDFPHQAEKLIKEIVNKHNKIYLSICLDAFSSSVAPGVSAVSPHGLLPSHAIPLLRRLAQSGKVVGVDLVELAPALDHQNMTAKLGAFCLVEFLYHLRLSHE